MLCMFWIWKKTVLCINVMTKGWIAFDGKIKLHYTANWKVRYRGEFEMTHRVWIGCFCWYCMMFVVGILATWLVGSLVFSPNVPGFFCYLWKLYCGCCAVKWRPSFHTGYEAPFELSFTILTVLLNSCTRRTHCWRKEEHLFEALPLHFAMSSVSTRRK